ncbi:MAG: Nramp family divalent metal transporter, partial [Methyloceanibacter sp.]
MSDPKAQQANRTPRRPSLVAMVGPGLLLAATGVGAGDLATGSFVGSLLGTAVLWAVVVGALMKFFVTEGLARWQIATGETLLEG